MPRQRPAADNVDPGHGPGSGGRIAASALVLVSLIGTILGLASPARAQTETTPSSAPPTTATTSVPATEPPAPTSSLASSTTSSLSTAPTTLPPSTLPATSAPVPSTAPTSKPGSGATGSTTTTTTTVPAGTIVIPPGKVLKVGSKGPDVRALEERLEQLNIDTGKVDGRFDWSTWQGVVAFQKYWGLKRTGKVDNELRIAIQKSPEFSGFIFSGPPTRLEVDKSKQLLFMFQDGQLWRVVSVSTGSGKKYCDYSKKAQREICGTASTPTGRFKIQRRIPGWRESDLGRLYNPLYFNGGIAFHGAPSVPAYPASHGCVRLPMSIAEWFPDEVANGTAVYVYD